MSNSNCPIVSSGEHVWIKGENGRICIQCNKAEIKPTRKCEKCGAVQTSRFCKDCWEKAQELNDHPYGNGWICPLHECYIEEHIDYCGMCEMGEPPCHES